MSLTPYDRCRIAIEQVGAVAGSVPAGSCAWRGLIDAIDELWQLADELEASKP